MKRCRPSNTIDSVWRAEAQLSAKHPCRRLLSRESNQKIRVDFRNTLSFSEFKAGVGGFLKKRGGRATVLSKVRKGSIVQKS